MTDGSNALEAALARLECEQIMMRSMTNIDGRRSDLNLEYFTEDAHFGARGAANADVTGLEALRVVSEKRDARPERNTLSVVAGFDFQWISSDEAEARGNFVRWVGENPAPELERWLGRFVRVDGSWKLREMLTEPFPPAAPFSDDAT
ncbi:nuclear transport factor 2 family protein [Williamsia soli]|uniref:nuclear transport factor 2 family protein n=1 Tax=Williamsia soli TaxID=364929 RepID=UPI001A9D65F5|nr:nuclear transport factor 2 family protein [Williamsia soli]